MNVRRRSRFAKRAVTFTGIANDSPFKSHVRNTYRIESHTAFGDHHAFTPADVERINSTFASMPQPRLIVTTEKDAARLVGLDGLSGEVRADTTAEPEAR